MRRVLMVVLGLGVIFGYGGAIASAARHARYRHGGCDSWQSRQWRGGGDWRGEAGWRENAPRVEATPVTQTTVTPAAAPAPSPQTFVIIGGGAQPAAQPIVLPSAPAAQPLTLPQSAVPNAAPGQVFVLTPVNNAAPAAAPAATP